MLQSLIIQMSTTIQVHDMSKSSEKKKNMLTAFPVWLFSIIDCRNISSLQIEKTRLEDLFFNPTTHLFCMVASVFRI